MRLKVKLCDAVAIKNLVLAASSLPCDVDLQSGSFVVDAKSILGVLGLPKQDTGILQVHSDDPNVHAVFGGAGTFGDFVSGRANDSENHISGVCTGRNADRLHHAGQK